MKFFAQLAVGMHAFISRKRVFLPKQMLFHRTSKGSNAGFEFEVDEVANVIAQTDFGVDGDVAEGRIEGNGHVLDGDGTAVHFRLKESHDTVNDLTRAGVNELVGQSDRVVCKGEGALDAIKTFALVSAGNIGGEYPVFKGGILCGGVFSVELKRAINDRCDRGTRSQGSCIWYQPRSTVWYRYPNRYPSAPDVRS